MRRQWIAERAKIKADEATHPMLGTLISDLGYKKGACVRGWRAAPLTLTQATDSASTVQPVYCASIRQLGDCPIWESQRILRRDRAESIAAEKRKKGFPVQIPGIITIYSLPDGSFKLLDGQHRWVGRCDQPNGMGTMYV